MVNQTLQSLENHANDPLLGSVIREALDFISASRLEREDGPSGSGQSSKSVADLHAFRKRSGYYRPGAITGLDETISSLGHADSLVWSRVIETNKGYIAMWFDGQEKPRGILLFKKDDRKSPKF